MADLITLSRAKDQIPGYDGDDAALSLCVTACSRAVENYCNRTFAQATYDVPLSGGGSRSLWLPNPPVARVESVRTSRVGALFVTNNAQVNSLATVEVTATGLTLTRVNNAVPSTNTLLFTTYPLVGDLNAAINALGGGWSSTVSDQFASWPSTEFAALAPITLGARLSVANLDIWYWTANGYRLNAETGELYAPAGWLCGFQNYRVRYTGGYADTPDELQQAVAELVQLTYIARSQNPNMQSETLDKYSYTRAAQSNLSNLTATARMTLNNYRLLSVERWTE